MGTFGIKLQNELSLPENVQLARHAETAGLDSVWSSEYRAEAIVPMAAYAAVTERITIASAIVQLYTRSATLLAMTAASLAELAPGRVVLGVGTSTEVIIGRWHGQERRKPLRAARENIVALRELLAGEKTSFDGEIVSVDGFQLEHGKPPAEVPIYAAALGEKMLAVAGREADGALLNATPFHHLPAIRARVDAAAGEAGRPPGSVRLAGDVRVGIATGAALERIRERQRKAMAFYAKMPPYNRFFAEAGYEAQAARMREAWEADDRNRAVAAFDDEMLDQIIVIGERSQVRDRLAEIAVANGLDTNIVYPLWDDDEDPATAIREIVELVAEVNPT